MIVFIIIIGMDRHTLSNKLREIIKQKGLKVYWVAKQIGLSPDSLSRYFRTSNLLPSKLDKLIDLLGYELRLVKKGGE